jgi:transposase
MQKCVCEGLKAIFDYIDGVAKRLVFDNAAGVGRKLCNFFRSAEMFGAFAAHYGFEFSFCNLESGNEKGGVENKVGAIRRSLLVLLAALMNLETYNRHLLERCKELSGKKHYKKGEAARQLFIEDVFALMGLPENPFDVIAMRSTGPATTAR